MTPEDILNFIELSPFVDGWEDYGLTQSDLAALQICIMCSPRRGQVMVGTRSLRKMRFAPKDWNTGQRGSLRVCYVYFERYGVVLLCLVFKKGEMDNLSDRGKKAINRAIERIELELTKKYGF